MTQFVLYSTLGCHLCEKAKHLIEAVPAGQTLDWREADIALDERLIEQYGVRIPVLRHCTSGEELGWPFDSHTLRLWLQAVAERSEGD